MKIDFREIQVKDIEGNNSTVDIAKMLGNAIYQKTADLGELELAQNIYRPPHCRSPVFSDNPDRP